ncbi:uncharacterized protein C8R40DRAFT_1070111 [Lentinula edodes]|uniref:uncharacterized protein n=1 Tax=Lentinula edodes TaxID=5353 RepID=UPI001E8DE8D0|nr:uncharacterized protein C8R40DRAFT_1070111 [Lentinula edodes]KAH7874299.1 hypothetical protein C8R40DRAFT_1070111 [Lentinula edodes]
MLLVTLHSSYCNVFLSFSITEKIHVNPSNGLKKTLLWLYKTFWYVSNPVHMSAHIASEILHLLFVDIELYSHLELGGRLPRISVILYLSYLVSWLPRILPLKSLLERCIRSSPTSEFIPTWNHEAGYLVSWLPRILPLKSLLERCIRSSPTSEFIPTWNHEAGYLVSWSPRILPLKSLLERCIRSSPTSEFIPTWNHGAGYLVSWLPRILPLKSLLKRCIRSSPTSEFIPTWNHEAGYLVSWLPRILPLKSLLKRCIRSSPTSEFIPTWNHEAGHLVSCRSNHFSNAAFTPHRHLNVFPPRTRRQVTHILFHKSLSKRYIYLSLQSVTSNT